MGRLQDLQSVAAQATRGELVFPTTVAVANRIRAALDDPDLHVAAAARLVQAEPLLAARCVAMANSAAYNRSGRTIADVAGAISRLGLQVVRSLVRALIVRQIAGMPKDNARRELADRLWHNTAQVASLSRLVAARVTHLPPDTALFAGLVHNVGRFYLLSRSIEFASLLEPPTEESEIDLETEINRNVAAALSLPPAIVEALEAVWKGYLASPPVTLGDTVLLAISLAHFASPFVRLQDSRVIAPIEMEVGDELLTGILEESAEDVHSLTQALAWD